MKPEPTPYDVLFDHPDLLVKHHRGADRLLVTFSPAQGRPRAKTRGGFGEGVFERHGYSTIHFISSWDHWWQTAACREAVAAARKAIDLANPSRITTYGASMGAYAAALFATRLRADAAVMLAPQWTIDDRKPPFERRWSVERPLITFQDDDMAAVVSETAAKYVIYDPFLDADRKQAEFFLTVPGTIPVPIPLCGHAPAEFLRQTGRLRAEVMTMFDGTFRYSQHRQQVRATRAQSPLYWSHLAKAASRHPARSLLAVEAARRARDLMPASPTYLSVYIKTLAAAGESVEALREAEFAVDRFPTNFALWSSVCVIAGTLGQHDKAIAASRRGVELSGHRPDAHRLLTSALVNGGYPEEAQTHLCEALDRFPNDRLLRLIAGRLGLSTPRSGEELLRTKTGIPA